jgi:hypothetical protein
LPRLGGVLQTIGERVSVVQCHSFLLCLLGGRGSGLLLGALAVLGMEEALAQTN